jgi:hypothetical protein
MLGYTQSLNQIMVNFLTSSYRVIGKVNIGSSGLVGLLSNQTTSIVEASDVSMARIHEPRVLANKLQMVRMVKHGIVAVGVGRREDLGPQSIARGGFGRLTEYQVRCVTSSYEFEGVLEWAGRFNISAILSEGSNIFIPLYNVKLRAIRYPDLSMESPAMVVNRRKIDIITQLVED